MVVIRAPMHHPPRPSTIGYNDRDAALALRPDWPRLCTHQGFHTSNRIVWSARSSMARTRRSRAGYSESLIKLYSLASQFCYWSPAEVLTTHQPTRRAWLDKTGREPKGYPEREYARK